MADIMFRTRFVWSGWAGSPGYTSFYGNGNVPGNAQTFATAAWQFMNASKTMTAAGDAYTSTLRITQDPFVTLVETTDGKEQGITAVTPGAQIAGTSVATFGAPAGACLNWITANFVNGRRLRGKTYLVPLASTLFGSDGTLAQAYLTSIANAANGFLTSTTPPLVWHRPTSKGATDGQSTTALSMQIADRVAVLRTRRA